MGLSPSDRRLFSSNRGTGTGHAGACPLEPWSDARTKRADFFNILLEPSILDAGNREGRAG
jgi:hypothetical protein